MSRTSLHAVKRLLQNDFTCLKPWPNGLASWRKLKTWVHLRWFALTLVEIKFARKSTQLFHLLATQPNSTQVEWRLLTCCDPMHEKPDISALKWVLLRLASTCEETSVYVWPPRQSLHAIATCGSLRVRLARALNFRLYYAMLFNFSCVIIILSWFYDRKIFHTTKISATRFEAQ